LKILFITSSPLGDAVLTTGLLDHLIKIYPKCDVTVACGPLPAPVFENVPEVREIIPLKKQKHSRHWLELWKKVSRTRWDIVVDLRNSIVSRLIFAKKRYIFGPHIDRSLHKVEQNAAVMGLSPPPPPRLWLSDEQCRKAEKLVPEGGPVLGIGPTANWQGKTWPPGCFIELVAELIKPDGPMPFSRIAVFGAPGEEFQAKPVIGAFPMEMVVNLVGKTDPGTAGAALRRCAIYIGNDSGLMHMAAAAGIPTVGLFGPSYPHLYRPWGEHCIYVRTPEAFDELIDYEGYDPATAPCLMTSLEVDAVLPEITKFLKKRKGASEVK
jgi:lipopolysaccharide export system permease protein